MVWTWLSGRVKAMPRPDTFRHSEARAAVTSFPGKRLLRKPASHAMLDVNPPDVTSRRCRERIPLQRHPHRRRPAGARPTRRHPRPDALLARRTAEPRQPHGRPRLGHLGARPRALGDRLLLAHRAPAPHRRRPPGLPADHRPRRRVHRDQRRPPAPGPGLARGELARSAGPAAAGGRRLRRLRHRHAAPRVRRVRAPC